MKKDIKIPVVENVFMAVVKEYNNEFKCDDWNAYIINNKSTDLDMMLIVSNGFDKTKGLKTAVMRHKLDKLPANSFAKVELMQEEILKLTNTFSVTFFEDSQLLEKKFTFEKDTIKDSALRVISYLDNKKGILIK